MITIKINTSKIDKTKLFKGEKGTYLDVVLIETPDGQYGDYMAVQGTSKEEREKGIKGAILGNGKIIHSRKQDSKESKPKPADSTPESDDVPF